MLFDAHCPTVCLVHHSAFHTEGTLSHHLVVYFPGFIWWCIFSGLIYYVPYFLWENAAFCDSTTLTPFSILSAVQHSLRSLFFLQYNTHSVLYSFYSTTLTPFSTVQHSLRSLFFLQYIQHSLSFLFFLHLGMKLDVEHTD